MMAYPLSVEYIVSFFFIILGAVNCFFGWYFFKINLMIYSFLGGAVIGLFTIKFLPFTNVLVYLIVTVIAGLMLVYLVFKILKLVLFINGIALGVLLYAIIMPEGNLSANIIGTVFSGLLGGILFLVSHKSIMIILTALVGAFLVVCGSVSFLGYPYLITLFSSSSMQEAIQSLHTFWAIFPLAITTILLAMIGVFCQCSLDLKKAKK